MLAGLACLKTLWIWVAISLQASASSNVYLADRTWSRASAVDSFQFFSRVSYQREIGPVRRASFSRLVTVVVYHSIEAPRRHLAILALTSSSSWSRTQSLIRSMK